MASPISTLSICSSSYARNSMPSMSSLTSCSCCSYSSHTSIKALNFHLSSRFSHMGLCHLTPWNGLRHMGISISPKYPKLGSRGKCKGKVIYASLFGVGAPEALVIGAVALLVFGPKGLAEVARNLGKTLRAFQPTIRELQEVSREFKNSLEREIGLDDDLDSVRNTYQSSAPNTSSQAASTLEDSQSVSVADPNGAPPNNAYSSEEFLKITEEQLKASGSARQDVASAPLDSQTEIESQPQGSNSANNAYSSEEYLKVTEEQLKAAAVKQQDVASLPPESEIEVESQPQGGFQETAIAESMQKPESEA